MIPYENKTKTEYINSFDIKKSKINKNINLNKEKTIENNTFDVNNFEIEKYQLTIFKSV